MTEQHEIPSLFALARKGDPETSHAAARAMNKGKASRQGQKILTALSASNGLTAGELEEKLGFHTHKRMAELERLGLVLRGYQARKCRVSGTMRLTWWVG